MRLVPDPARGVRAELVEDAAPGDLEEQIPDGPRVLVEATLFGTVDVGEHDVLVMAPSA